MEGWGARHCVDAVRVEVKGARGGKGGAPTRSGGQGKLSGESEI